MFFNPMFLMGWMLVLAIVSSPVSIVAIPFTVLIEAWLLKRGLLKGCSTGRVLRNSLVINIVSGIIGNIIIYIIGLVVCVLLLDLYALHPDLGRYSHYLILSAVVVIWFVLVSMFVLVSTLVETPVLVWLERKWLGSTSRKHIFAMVLKINIWSNLLVFLISLILLTIYLISLVCNDLIIPIGEFLPLPF